MVTVTVTRPEPELRRNVIISPSLADLISYSRRCRGSSALHAREMSNWNYTQQNNITFDNSWGCPLMRFVYIYTSMNELILVTLALTSHWSTDFQRVVKC